MEKLPFEVGDEIKNYKAMCELLGEKVRTSVSKKAQLKRWGNHFTWENRGHRFLITEIIDPKFPTHDNNRIGQGIKKHSNELQSILLHFLKAHNTKYNSYWINISMKGLIELAQIFTTEFHKIPYDIEEVIEENKENFQIQKVFLNDFYTRIYTTTANDIKTALNQLEQKSIIAVEEIYMGRPSECIVNGVSTRHLPLLQSELKELKLEDMFIAYLNHFGVASDESYDEYNLKTKNKSGAHSLRELQPFETNVFLGIRERTLREENLKNVHEVYRNNKVNKFFNHLNYELKKIMKMEYIFKGYRIIFLPHVIEKQELYKSFKLDSNTLQEVQKNFKLGFQNNIKENYKVRQEKSQRKNLLVSCYNFEAQAEVCDIYPVGMTSTDKLLLGVDNLESVIEEMLNHFMVN